MTFNKDIEVYDGFCDSAHRNDIRKGLIFPSFQTAVQTFTHNSITSDLMQGTEII